MFGYNGERGLWSECAALFLSRANTSGLCFGVRFFELLNDCAYDLLDDRKELALRADEHGNLQVRGATHVDEDSGAVTVDNAQHCVKSLDQLETMIQNALQLREVGSSSVHAQSSRSHALLEIELVTGLLFLIPSFCHFFLNLISISILIPTHTHQDELVNARNQVMLREGEAAPIGKAHINELIKLSPTITKFNINANKQKKVIFELMQFKLFFLKNKKIV